LQKGIRQPKKYPDGTVRYGLLSSTGEPRTLPATLNDPHWRAAMQDEYDALMLNKTLTLVPPNSNKNIIDCKWVYRIKNMLMVLLIITIGCKRFQAKLWY
jgi:hypothetical protein